jgi:acyl carrier protein
MSLQGNEYKDTVRRIWSDTLSVDVSDDTDFFDVGGHSYMALEIIAKIDEAYGCRLPLRSLFDHSRFSDFTVAIAAAVVTQ